MIDNLKNQQYPIFVKKKDGVFLLSIPDIYCFAENESLSDAYDSILLQKEQFFSDISENGYALNQIERLEDPSFEWKKTTKYYLIVLLVLIIAQPIINVHRPSLVITASSSNGSSFDPGEITLPGSNKIWHAKSPPKYPEWVEFDYDSKRTFNSLIMESQPDSFRRSEYRRAPKEFTLQAYDGSVWLDLLKVKDSKFTYGSQKRTWSFDNTTSYKKFKIIIFSNHGDKEFLTIAKVAFSWENNSQAEQDVLSTLSN